MAEKYRTILVDPPWHEEDVGDGVYAGWPYPRMPLSEIVKLPVVDLADRGCHLWMWSTNQTIPHAVWLIQQWGFRYMNMVTWVKASGQGFWWANITQQLIFSYLPPLRMKSKMQPTAFGATPRKHSQKPDLSYEIIEKVSFAPMLELFARRTRPGWDVWGDEVKGVNIWPG